MMPRWSAVAIASILFACATCPALCAVPISGIVRIDHYEGSWTGYYGGFPWDPTSGVTKGFSLYMQGWSDSNTDAITALVENRNRTLPPSANPEDNCLDFLLSGYATPGVSRAYLATDLRLGGQTYYHVAFDWWIALWMGNVGTVRLEIPGYPDPIWSFTSSGTRSGHVDMDIPWEQHAMSVDFVVSVVGPVPEPTPLAMVGVGAAGMCLRVAGRRCTRRNVGADAEA